MKTLIIVLVILVAIVIWLLVRAYGERVSNKELYEEAVRLANEDAEIKRAKKLTARLNQIMGGEPWEN